MGLWRTWPFSWNKYFLPHLVPIYNEQIATVIRLPSKGVSLCKVIFWNSINLRKSYLSFSIKIGALQVVQLFSLLIWLLQALLKNTFGYCNRFLPWAKCFHRLCNNGLIKMRFTTLLLWHILFDYFFFICKHICKCILSTNVKQATELEPKITLISKGFLNPGNFFFQTNKACKITFNNLFFSIKIKYI